MQSDSAWISNQNAFTIGSTETNSSNIICVDSCVVQLKQSILANIAIWLYATHKKKENLHNNFENHHLHTLKVFIASLIMKWLVNKKKHFCETGNIDLIKN